MGKESTPLVVSFLLLERSWWHVIKRFIKKVEENTTDAWIAILTYIDRKLDEYDRQFDRHKKRMNDIDDRLSELEDNFKPVKTTVDSNSERVKSYTKIAVNTVIGAVILYILSRFGIG